MQSCGMSLNTRNFSTGFHAGPSRNPNPPTTFSTAASSATSARNSGFSTTIAWAKQEAEGRRQKAETMNKTGGMRRIVRNMPKDCKRRKAKACKCSIFPVLFRLNADFCRLFPWPPPSPPNSVISANDLEMKYGVQTILSHATLAINEGDRIGLVGRNGTGKSTFLRMMAGVLAPDAGSIIRRRELIVGYLPQDFQLDDAKTVEANILTGAQAVLDLIAEYENRRTRKRPRRANCLTTSTISTAGTWSTAPPRSSIT